MTGDRGRTGRSWLRYRRCRAGFERRALRLRNGCLLRPGDSGAAELEPAVALMLGRAVAPRMLGPAVARILVLAVAPALEPAVAPALEPAVARAWGPAVALALGPAV